MRNFVLLLVLLAGGISGYFIGSYHGKAAIEALAAAKQAAQEAKAESDKTNKAMEEKVAGLSAEHKNELDKIESSYQQQLLGLNRTLQDKDTKLKDMTHRATSNQQEIARLRNSAQDATNPAEKQKLLDRVAQLEEANRNLQSGIEGFKCLSATIPGEIIQQLRGEQP